MSVPVRGLGEVCEAGGVWQQGQGWAGQGEVGGVAEPLVGLHVLLQVILPSERLPAAGQRAGEGLQPGVDALVSGQLLVAGEGLAAAGVRARVRPLPRVDAHVSAQLPVVAEAGAALLAPVLLGPHRAPLLPHSCGHGELQLLQLVVDP